MKNTKKQVVYKILIAVLIVGILLIGGWWIWKNQQIQDYKIYEKYCQKDQDCGCSTCGCLNFYWKDKMECETTYEGAVCDKVGCVCKDNQCVLLENKYCEKDEDCIFTQCCGCARECNRKCNIKPKATPCKCENNQCVPTVFKQIVVTTDKAEYNQGELVKISIKNNLKENIGVVDVFNGIETFSDGKWQNLWELTKLKCSCDQTCYLGVIPQIEPGKEMSFKWNQKLWTYCHPKASSHDLKNSTFIIASPGKYRICVKLRYLKSGNEKIICSYEFVIKNLVTLTTDKTEYEQGEIVKITVKSDSGKVCYPKYRGSDCWRLPFGVERFIEDEKKWKNIRIGKSIMCPQWKAMPATECSHSPVIFMWDQQEMNKGQVPPGKYRIKFGGVYSNEFTIKRKSGEKTPEWKTYTNKEYGFEIKHPSYISPTTTPNDWADGMVDLKRDGKLLVNFIACQFSKIPLKEPYHSFTGEIRIRVNPDITDAKDCLNLPLEFPNMKEENVNINGIGFKKFSKIEDTAMGRRLKMEVYRTLHNNTCFSIEKVEHGYLFDELERPSSPHFDFESTKKFNSCRKILDQILSTFRFLKRN